MMPNIFITYSSPGNSDAEALWVEGNLEFLNNGTITSHSSRTVPSVFEPYIKCWVAYVDDQPAAAYFARVWLPPFTTLHGLMVYVRPAYRGQRLYAHIQAVMDPQLISEGITETFFNLPDTENAEKLVTAVTTRGGEQIGEEVVQMRKGATRMRTFRRLLQP
jgi:hypothetical protein